jgi:hypothetical protein
MKLKVTPGIYNSHQIGQQIWVTAKGGRLGYEWVAGLQ